MANLPSITVTDGDRVISSALDISDPALHDGIKAVVTNATSRWLKNEEVLTVLESFQVEGVVWPKEASEKPDGEWYTVSEATHMKHRGCTLTKRGLITLFYSYVLVCACVQAANFSSSIAKSAEPFVAINTTGERSKVRIEYSTLRIAIVMHV